MRKMSEIGLAKTVYYNDRRAEDRLGGERNEEGDIFSYNYKSA